MKYVKITEQALNSFILEQLSDLVKDFERVVRLQQKANFEGELSWQGALMNAEIFRMRMGTLHDHFSERLNGQVEDLEDTKHE